MVHVPQFEIHPKASARSHWGALDLFRVRISRPSVGDLFKIVSHIPVLVP